MCLESEGPRVVPTMLPNLRPSQAPERSQPCPRMSLSSPGAGDTFPINICILIVSKVLPIPELVPFRLTPQMTSFMGPMRERGLFERTMVHALQALRDNADILLSTMDIFINEPSLDWIVSGTSQVFFA